MTYLHDAVIKVSSVDENNTWLFTYSYVVLVFYLWIICVYNLWMVFHIKQSFNNWLILAICFCSCYIKLKHCWQCHTLFWYYDFGWRFYNLYLLFTDSYLNFLYRHQNIFCYAVKYETLYTNYIKFTWII